MDKKINTDYLKTDKDMNETGKYQYLMDYKGLEHEKLQNMIMNKAKEHDDNFIITNIERFTLASLPKNNIYIIETAKKVSDDTLKKNIIDYVKLYEHNTVKDESKRTQEFQDLEYIIDISSIGSVRIFN